MNAPAVQPNAASAPHDILRHGFHLRRTYSTVQISGKPKQMLRVSHAANLGIVSRTPDAGTTAVHNGNRDAQPVPDFIYSTHHGFLRLHREPTAAAAGASKFLPGEILDIVPERPGFRRVAAFRLLHLYRRPGDSTNQHFLGSRTRYPVHGKPVVSLKRPDSRLRVLTVSSVNCAGRIAQIGQKALDLLYRHTFTSSQPLGYAEGDHTLLANLERYTLPPSVQQSPLL
nr:MAG TPA: hypothetical protein [Caudoviricetes sp.]